VRWGSGSGKEGEVEGTGDAVDAGRRRGLGQGGGDRRPIDEGRAQARRLRQRERAMIGVMVRPEGLEMGDPRERILPPTVKHRGVGERQPEGSRQEEPGEQEGAQSRGGAVHASNVPPVGRCNKVGQPPANYQGQRRQRRVGVPEELATGLHCGIFNVST
jgi:hypothetical protein